MKIALKILPKKDILDVQGRAVQNILVQEKMKVSNCFVGKYVILEFPKDTTEAEAMSLAHDSAKSVICNQLIETYELELIQ